MTKKFLVLFLLLPIFGFSQIRTTLQSDTNTSIIYRGGLGAQKTFFIPVSDTVNNPGNLVIRQADSLLYIKLNNYWEAFYIAGGDTSNESVLYTDSNDVFITPSQLNDSLIKYVDTFTNQTINGSKIFSQDLQVGHSSAQIGTGNGSGANNIRFGNGALAAVTTGTSNISLGAATMNHTTTGSSNIGIGYSTNLYNIDGSNNIAIGIRSLQSNIHGSKNISIGNFAGGINTDTSINNMLYIGNKDSANAPVNQLIIIGNLLTKKITLPGYLSDSLNQYITTDNDGNVISHSWCVTNTITLPNDTISSGFSDTITVNVTGARIGDIILVDGLSDGLIYKATCVTNDIVTILAFNALRDAEIIDNSSRTIKIIKK